MYALSEIDAKTFEQSSCRLHLYIFIGEELLFLGIRDEHQLDERSGHRSMAKNVEVGELDAAVSTIEAVHQLVVETLAEPRVIVDIDARTVGIGADERIDMDT